MNSNGIFMAPAYVNKGNCKYGRVLEDIGQIHLMLELVVLNQDKNPKSRAKVV